MERRRRATSSSVTLAIAAGALALALATPASAAPTVWARARDPLSVQVEEAMRFAMKADLEFHKKGSLRELAPVHLGEARKRLSAVIAAGANDFNLRLLYAELLRDLRDQDELLRVLTLILKDDPPAPIRADALGELAICHAVAGRREEEIRAYTDALAVEPHTLARARLLGNRAEAFMAMGDLQAAVEGYRSALARLTTLEMFQIGSTTLFGLGVALDRIGNLEAGVESVKLARAYDPSDRRFAQGWFFSPTWDAHWYWALGGLTTGRSSGMWAARAEGYAKAAAEWDLYLQEAPADDRWIPLARVRLEQVKREQAEMQKRYEAEKKRAREAEKSSSEPPRPSR